MTRIATALAALLFLSGCAANKAVEPVTITLPCRVTIPARPIMPTESISVDVDLDTFISSAVAEIERREGYEIELRAALEACQSP